MNLEALKKVIREEVRIVFREELQEVLLEAVRIASTPEYQEPIKVERVEPQTKVVKNIDDNYSSNIVKDFKTINPIEKMLEETKLNFTSQDARNFYGGADLPNNKAASMAHSMGMSGDFPGVDLGSLSFLKNAKNILDKSKQIDKDRTGGN